MNRNYSIHRREQVVSLALALLFGCGIFVFRLLIGGQAFLSMPVASAVLVLLIGLRYLLWGWSLDRTRPGSSGHEDVWSGGEGGAGVPAGPLVLLR
jgi:hypothetical protein